MPGSKFKTPKNKEPDVDWDNPSLRRVLAEPNQPPIDSDLPLADWRRLEANRAENQSSREGHSASICGDHLWIFGGLEFGKRSDSFIALNMETLKWAQIVSEDVPRARCYHASATFGEQYIFIQGGEGIETGDEKMERSSRFGSMLRTRRTMMRDTPSSSPTKTRRSSQGGHERKSGEEPDEKSETAARVNTINMEGRPNAILLDDLHFFDTTKNTWKCVMSSLSPLPTKSHTMVCIFATDLKSKGGDEQGQAQQQTAIPYLVTFGGSKCKVD